MSLLLHIMVTYIKENIIIKLQKLYSPPRNRRAGNKSPALFVKKPFCTGDLSYIMFEQKEYKGVMIDELFFLRIDAKFEGKLICVFKNDMKNLANFQRLKSSDFI